MRILVGTLFSAVLLAIVSAAQAQTWPTRPVRIILSNSAGGSPDIVTRMVADRLSKAFNQPFLIENRPGGESVIGAEIASKAAPDGYTFYLATNDTHAANRYRLKSQPFDADRDFTPVANVIDSAPFVVAVHPDLPVTSYPELVSYAKARPGKLSVGITIGISDVLAQWMNKTAGTDIVRIRYKLNPQAAQDAMAGQIQVLLISLISIDSFVKAGKLRVIAVSASIGRLKRREPMARGFEFVRKLTARTVKATLPAPSVNHFFRGDHMLEKGPYRGDRKAYFRDIAAIYRQEIAELAAQGCTYLQIDDVPSAVVCDPRNAQVIGDRGEDPEALIDQYYEMFNDAVRERPATMTIGVHLCRGNSGHGQASGGYERIAERLFQKLDANVYFLEYDPERAGGFEPLRHLPRDRFAVLGMISTKLPALELVDELRRRVDQAARFVDLERLCLSPQCGFASSYEQTRFSEADEVRKLEHLVTASQKI